MPGVLDSFFNGLKAQPKAPVEQDLSETIEKRKAAIFVLIEFNKEKRDAIIAIFLLFVSAFLSSMFGMYGAMVAVLLGCGWFMFRIFMINMDAVKLSSKYKLAFVPGEKAVDISKAPIVDVTK